MRNETALRHHDTFTRRLVRWSAVGIGSVYPYLPPDTIVGAARRFLGRNHYPMGQLFLEKGMVALRSILRGANPRSRRKIVECLVVNECIAGQRERRAMSKQLGFEVPALLVISPTMRCPLNCYGCYSAQYGRDQDLAFDVFDRLLTEAESLGIHFFVISGGEPFVYPRIHELFRKHDRSWFQVYTSGITLRNDGAERLARLGNVMPCISVEGFRDETDARRGEGHFNKVLAAFEALREHGVPFGFSATATRLNNELVTSDEFVRFYTEQGACLGWYFQYMPIGREPQLNLMPTPQQRDARLHRILELRRTHDILLADFWNDGPLSGGCLAGARRYVHVNHAGDVEPCVFCQISTDNLHQKGLVEILRTSPLFKAIRKRQPYSDNYLRPCIIIDNPEMLKEVIAETDPRETCGGGAKRLVTDLYPRLKKYADEYAPFAERSWRELYADTYKAAVEEARELSKPFVDSDEREKG